VAESSTLGIVRARIAVAVGAIAAIGPCPDAGACAPAPPEGAFVAVAEESAIIVWDEATKTEHFVRRASFQSESRDFGFLVPTPSKPELAEAPEDVFATLEGAIRPPIVHENSGFEPVFSLFYVFARSTRAAAVHEEALDPVRVLETKRVAGYDAVVLEADDPAALARWLATRGYAKRPALDEWLRPYVEKKWKLTAFKIADPDDGGASDEARRLGTTAVRMSFATERPFFPYREPRDQREAVPKNMTGPRSLRVFFVGAARVGATIGDGSTPFLGKTAWSAPIDGGYLRGVPGVPNSAWLTVIEDEASPRPGVEELWLDRSKDGSEIKPAPIVIAHPYPIPVDLCVLVGGVGYGIYRLARRKRATGASPSE
jgi:hypothetical protein